MKKSLQDELLFNTNKLSPFTRGQIYYPPILDIDPIFAADFLTIEDSEKCFKLMKEVFKDLTSEKQQHKVLETSILYSKTNFEWFASFALRLAELNEGIVEIPYKFKEGLKKGPEFVYFPPLKLSKGLITFRYFRVKDTNPITHYRIQYIKEAYEVEAFRDGYPVWYMLSNTTIFERYDSKTGVRSRIDFNNGELHYYLAGASDNWKKLVGVPLEMDYIVSSLLFRN